MSTANLNNFLNANRRKDNTVAVTNTRIGDSDLGIYGGSYSISDLDYAAFLNKYRTEIVETGTTEYLTEMQLINDGPGLVDLDFRFTYETVDRKYTKDHIDDLIGAYSEELIKMFQFGETSVYQIYVLEKSAINRVEEKRVTKDGIHLIIGISTERKMRIVLRNRMIARLAEMWQDMPITNTWSDVLDEGIAQGHVGWQLYGSTKPGCEPYKLTYVYTIGYDPTDHQPTIDVKSTADPTWRPEWAELLPKLSARCRTHPRFFYRSDFVKELDGIPDTRRNAASSNNLVAASGSASEYDAAALLVRCRSDLDALIDAYLEKHTIDSNWELIELYWYTMALPEHYYGAGSYSRWIRVGMALKNSDPAAFLLWIAFSAKAADFDFDSICSMHDKWNSFGSGDLKTGITKRSIMYWCKSDAPKEYRAIQLKCAEAAAERAMGGYEDVDEEAKIDRKGTTDCDLAAVLHAMFRDDYKCVSITNNIWYKYEEPRWRKIDAGVDLRRCISGPLRSLYMKKATEYMVLRDGLSEEEDPRKIKKMTKFCDKILAVCSRLGSTNDKKNIMTEAKELFYDSSFMEKLDANPMLTCFKNGVVDYKEKRFRRGTPEDYLTKSTNIDYVPIDPVAHKLTIDAICDFMQKLFPDKQIHDYAWEHLASSMLGVLPNQTWHIYIGDGSNGKSMLIKLMEYVLGDYKGIMPINMLTDRRGKLGGAMPEIVNLKGLRLAVAQEPQKGDRINDGVVKELTSGTDKLHGRGLYMAQAEEFYPQFQLALCTNYLMETQSNDYGFWRRVRVLPFKSLFVEDPVNDDPTKPFQFKIDRNLENQLASWSEKFAAMLVEIAYKNMGKVHDCEMVDAARDAYRQSQDSIAEFIADRIVMDASGSISKTELGVEFKNWYEATYGRRGGPSIKEVQAYLDKDKRFKKFGKVWMGARISYDQDARGMMEDDDIPSASDL